MDEELDIFQDTTAEEKLFADTVAMAEETAEEERLYDYTNQREDGGSQNLYWGNYSKKVTEDELRELYNADDNARLRESFGTFENYLAYMNERQDLIDSGEYKADWWDTGVALVSEETLADPEAGMDDKAFEYAVMQEGANQGQIGYEQQEDVFKELYTKYTGEDVTKVLDNGAKYEWNGTSFVLTQEAHGFHFGSFLGEVLPAVVISAGIPAGALGGGITGGAAKGAIASAIGQGITGGKIDPDQLLQAAVIGGIGGFFDDLVAAEPGIYGGWVLDGEVVGQAGQWGIEKIQFLSDTFGIPFEEAAGIVEGILTGAISGEDLEGIAINAVGGWTKAKADEYIQNVFGDAGIDVENFFREGDTNISTESIQGLVNNAIQGLIDGGMDTQDVLTTVYDFFSEGGSLDFLLPGLPEIDVSGIDLPSFCETMPDFPGLCTETEFCKEDAEGNKPWYCGVELPDVCPPGYSRNEETGECEPLIDEIKCPEGWDMDEDGICIEPPTLCGEGYSWDPQLSQCVEVGDGIEIPSIKCPEGWDQDADGICIEPPSLCGEGYQWDPELKKCMPSLSIECPDGFRYDEERGECIQIPDVSIECPDGFRYDEERGECIQIPEATCPDGFRDEEGECVPIDGPRIDFPKISLGLGSFDSAFEPVAASQFGMGVARNAPQLTQRKDFPIVNFLFGPGGAYSGGVPGMFEGMI